VAGDDHCCCGLLGAVKVLDRDIAAAPLGAASAVLRRSTGVEHDEPDQLVVAAPFMLPTAGLSYAPEFFTTTEPQRRASAVLSSEGGELLRWRVDLRELSSAFDRVDAMDGGELRQALVRKNPPQAGVALGDAGRVLIPFEWERVRATGGRGPKFRRLRANDEVARRRAQARMRAPSVRVEPE